MVKNLPIGKRVFFFLMQSIEKHMKSKESETSFLSSLTRLPRGNHNEQPFYYAHMNFCEASQVAPAVRNLPAHAGDLRDVGSIPGLGRPPGGGRGSPLQYSCLESPMDRGAWWATVHGVTESDMTEVT